MREDSLSHIVSEVILDYMLRKAEQQRGNHRPNSTKLLITLVYLPRTIPPHVWGTLFSSAG